MTEEAMTALVNRVQRSIEWELRKGRLQDTPEYFRMQGSYLDTTEEFSQ